MEKRLETRFNGKKVLNIGVCCMLWEFWILVSLGDRAEVENKEMG